MKITIDVDCSPDEARAFLGLPDVGPVQQAFVEEMGERMMAALAAMDAESLAKAWMPEGMPGWEQWQKMWRSGGSEGES